MSSFSTVSSASSYAYPSTPNAVYDRDDETTPTSGPSVTTPPGTLRDYSAMLKHRHTMGMAAAMKSMPLERGPQIATMEYDDNPFDLLFSPGAKTVKRVKRTDTFGCDEPAPFAKEEPVAKPNSLSSAGAVASNSPAAGWRPSLLQFARRESDNTGNSSSTPGSESSFEGGSADDHLRVYGSKLDDNSPFSLSPYLQSSPALQVSSQSSAPTAGMDDSPPTNKLAHRASVASTATVTSLSSTSTVVISTSQPARTARPSLCRPRPRAHPYEVSAPNAIAPGGRSRENSGENGRGLSFSSEMAALKMDGRTDSEVIVTMAGLRCQRGRRGGRAT